MATISKPTPELTTWRVALVVLLLAGFLMLGAWN